jgi:hypothetical protein
LLLACAAGSAPTAAHADIVGAFAPTNWVLSRTGGGGIDTSAEPAAVTLYGGAAGVPATTLYSITVPYYLVLTFNWRYTNNDLYQDPLFEPAYFTVNGTPTELTDDLGAATQSGTGSVVLNAGSVFGLEATAFDGYYGGYDGNTAVSSYLTVSGLAVREPASAGLIAVGAAGLLHVLRRRPLAVAFR